jgi:pimeloyl-ACP methyl ester carboxylesterase
MPGTLTSISVTFGLRLEVGDNTFIKRRKISSASQSNHYPCCFFSLLFILLSFSASGFIFIDRQEAIEIGGIKQWISIQGIDEHGPVLLFLHGGPGNSAMGYGRTFTTELQKHFVVVQWDQRESGRTAKLNSSNEPLTVELMVKDAIEVIHYLATRFGKKKIYLMGHSWGGFLGLEVAVRHPELLEAYFAVSPMVNQLESERRALALMKDSATQTGNRTESIELASVQIPFQNANQLYLHRKWLAKRMSTGVPTKSFVMGWAKKWLSLFNQASEINFFVTAPEIKCPIYFFVGSRDYQTNFRVTEEYFTMVKAEKKDLFWFTNSAHSPNLTEPQKLQEIVIDLLPNH